jgi:hypothetical protein
MVGPLSAAKNLARKLATLQEQSVRTMVVDQGAWALARMSSGSWGMGLAPGTASRSPG